MPRAPLSFFVPGDPASAGSKVATPNQHTGRAAIRDTCKGKAAWTLKVARAAILAIEGEDFDLPLTHYKRLDLPTGPMVFAMHFLMPRPLDHYRRVRGQLELKPGAPYWHTIDPDTTKLVRCAEDALKGIAWKDDNQVVKQYPSKRWSNYGGVYIFIDEINGNHNKPGYVDLPASVEELLWKPREAPARKPKLKPLGHDKDMF